MSDETDAAELQAKQRPLLAEVAAINGRYGFDHRRERAPEDVARFDALWAEMRLLNDEYDRAHPLPPCAVCGSPIRASLAIGNRSGLRCQRIGRCRNAPNGAGG